MTYDRMWMGVGGRDGMLFEAYDPEWWQVWRWAGWLWQKHVLRRSAATIVVNGTWGPRSLRVVARGEWPPAAGAGNTAKGTSR